MYKDGTASLKVTGNENTPFNELRRSGRSPHPYHRRTSEVRQDHETNITALQNASQATNMKSSSFQLEVEQSTYFDADHRKRRKRSSSLSDSATEADDEKGLILLRLPPAPVRLRKGLIGRDDSGTASPLLTPSYLDEENRKLSFKAQNQRRSSLQSQSCTDEETVRLRVKFARRRRAELIRRLSETTLVAAIGFFACRREVQWLVSSHPKTGFHSAITASERGIGILQAALLNYAGVVLGLSLLYPVRIICHNHARNASRNRSRLYIHIPAAFEPAPLLYPILVPTFVALSLMHSGSDILLSNLTLSIASVPSKIIPFSQDVPWYSSMHWFLSTVPFLASQISLNPEFDYGEGNSATIGRCCAEQVLLLYPLHQALLPVLGHLTTSSLLPAELQLLSTSMINLLLLSQSPQSIILQSLIWIGGLLLLLLCSRILSLGVALARIPSWRFRRPGIHIIEGNALVSAIDDSLDGRLGKWGIVVAENENSDSDEMDPKRPLARNAHGHKLSLDTHQARALQHVVASNSKRQPLIAAMEQNAGQPDLWMPNGKVNAFQSNDRRRRRYTEPSYGGASSNNPSETTLRRRTKTLLQSIRSWSFRSLTKAQATVLNWIFAFYIYVMVTLIIVLPIRSYITHEALHEQEPVGWAIGYLLGDISLIRFYTVFWHLEHWIRLPPFKIDRYRYKPSSWVQVQVGNMGAANLRLLICIYCVSIILFGLVVVLRLSAVAEVDTRRKVFHGMMVAMFLPTIFLDPTFISLALILVLAIFLLLDLFRASQLPPLSKPLTYFLAPYVDGRDHRGPVIVSHMFLLIGCAIPLWLSLAAIPRSGDMPWQGWDVQKREVSMISGVVCVGMGDAAASLVGRRFGRHKWCWSGGKSFEGSLAFATAVVLGLGFARAWLLIGGWPGDHGDSWPLTLGKACIAAVSASFTEAVLTGGNDNVIVPVILWLLVRGLKI